jgi:hypothetical protein
MPPGKLTGTRKPRPSRNTFPPSPRGTVVRHVFVASSKTVVAVVAAGEKVTTAFGTVSV